MKKFFYSIIISLLVFICSFCGCSGNSYNKQLVENNTAVATSQMDSMAEIAVLEYKTNYTILQLPANDETALSLLDIVNYTDDTDYVPNKKPDYIVHMIDNGDSTQDIWLNIYLDNKKIYIQWDTEKYVYSKEMNITDKIMESTKTTADEFIKLIGNN
ncbi:MAG: hypothetical protein ACI31S_03075 [Bacilli bacterium]